MLARKKTPEVEPKIVVLAGKEDELVKRKKALDEFAARLEQKRKALDAREREMNQRHASPAPVVSVRKDSGIPAKKKNQGLAVLIPAIKHSEKSGAAGSGNSVKEKSKPASSAA